MPNGPVISYNNSHEQALIVCIPYLILSLFSVFFGYVFKDLFTGAGSDFLSFSLFIHPEHLILIEAESVDLFYKLLPAIISISSAFCAFMFYLPPVSNKVGLVRDEIVSKYLITSLEKVSTTFSP
jgi:NADH-ubiquinone oxidoreductase chain 5